MNIMGIWSKPTDWDAMTMDELYATTEMSRKKDKMIRKAQKFVSKTSKVLGTTEKVVNTANRVGFFDKIKAFFSHESGSDETE